MGTRDERIRRTPEEIRKLREGVLRLIAYATVGLGTPMVVAISLFELSAGRFDAVFGALLAAQVAFTAAIFVWREPRARAIALIVYLWIIGSAALLHAGPGVTAGFAYLSAALIACIHVGLRAPWIVLGAAAAALAGAAALSLSGGAPGYAAQLYDLSRPSNWLRLGGVSILFMACIVATFGMAMRRLERVALEAQAALEEIRRERDERRSAELAFTEAQRHEIVSRIAAGAAHDLNNVLTVVKGAADMASTASRGSRGIADELALIREGVRRASTLTRQLLSFGRRHEAPTRQPVGLSGVVLGLQGILERLVPADVDLSIDAPDGLPPVPADPSQIEQIVLNLCVNARDAMREGGGRLAVRVFAEAGDGGERVAVSVSDTGTGISEEVRARMFEPFFTTKPDGEGTGLGLATVRILAEAHGGRIACASRVGEGTTMTVSFPTAGAAGPAAGAVVDGGDGPG